MSATSGDPATFGSLLFAWRRVIGLTQEELSERSGLSVRTVGNLECDRTRSPHVDSLDRLAGALGLRGEARAEFYAAAGRRLANGTADVTEIPGGGQPQPDGRQPVPRQLPGRVRQFVGRETELAALTSLLDGSRQAAAIAVIGGMAGVGKTALAVHWAHQAATAFPDGQLYVNLHGYDPGKPMTASYALAGFLHAQSAQEAGERVAGRLLARSGRARRGHPGRSR